MAPPTPQYTLTLCCRGWLSLSQRVLGSRRRGSRRQGFCVRAGRGFGVSLGSFTYVEAVIYLSHIAAMDGYRWSTTAQNWDE